jgi:hypothetical protein
MNRVSRAHDLGGRRPAATTTEGAGMKAATRHVPSSLKLPGARGERSAAAATTRLITAAALLLTLSSAMAL